MIEMGRPKTAWLDLPPRMTARKLASGKIIYYYQAQGRKIPLGSNVLAAKQEWARLESGVVQNTFPTVAKQFREDTYKHLSESSKAHYTIALRNLEVAFRTFTLDQIQPADVKQYIRRRTKKAAALFEKKGIIYFTPLTFVRE